MPDKFIPIHEVEVVHCPKDNRLVEVKKTCVKCAFFAKRLYIGQFCGDIDCDQVQCEFKEENEK